MPRPQDLAVVARLLRLSGDPLRGLSRDLTATLPAPWIRRKHYDVAGLELLVVMREALLIPEVDMTLPAPGYRYEASGS
jgi:hypothetical protein